MRLQDNKNYSWYIVFISALIGLPMTAGFPQFTMVVTEFAQKISLSEDFLLFTDIIKSVAIMLGMLMSGPVYKKLGLKRTFTLSILLMVIPQILMPHAPGPIFLVSLKILQGLCSLSFPVFLITIMNWTQKDKLGSTTAVFNGLFYGGAGIGATLAGLTISLFDWESSFYVLAFLLLIPATIWFFTVKEKESYEDPLDLAPSSDLGRDNEESLVAPNMMKEVVSSKTSWLLILSLVSTIWMVQVLSVDLPLYAKEFNYPPEAIGLIMSSISFGIFAACILSGKVSDWAVKKTGKPALARLLVFTLSPLLTILSILLVLAVNKEIFVVFYLISLLLSFASAWGLGSFYSILPEILSMKEVEYSTGFVGGIADISMPVGPLFFGVLLGVRGYWTEAWLSCILISLISLISCIFLIKSQPSMKL